MNKQSKQTNIIVFGMPLQFLMEGREIGRQVPKFFEDCVNEVIRRGLQEEVC